MLNEYLEKPIEVGTVLKETFDIGVCYYLVGPYFIYNNDYDYPEIRPHKFIFDEHVSIASEDEKNQFIEDLKKNHLLVDNEYRVYREFGEFQLKVNVTTKGEMTREDVINMLNNLYKFSDKEDIKKVEFIDF